MVTLSDLDWLQYGGDDLLHHAVLDSTQERDMESDARCYDVTFNCGATSDTAWVPGPSSRMSDTRCEKCCVTEGLPRGNGSPKNDPACRIILGLD